MPSKKQTPTDGESSNSETASHTRARELTTKREKITYIVELMEALDWRKGKTAGELAAIWGVAENTVEHYAAEASRQVTADADEARRDISAGCRKLFAAAIKDADAKSAKMMGELWAMVSGAKAAERHEVTTVEASPEAAAAKLREIFRSNVNRNNPGEARADLGDVPEGPASE